MRYSRHTRCLRAAQIGTGADPNHPRVRSHFWDRRGATTGGAELTVKAAGKRTADGYVVEVQSVRKQRRGPVQRKRQRPIQRKRQRPVAVSKPKPKREPKPDPKPEPKPEPKPKQKPKPEPEENTADYADTSSGGFKCLHCDKVYKKSSRAEKLMQAHVEKEHL